MTPRPPLPPEPDAHDPWPVVALRMAFRIALLAGLVIAVHQVLNWLDSQTHTIGQPQMLEMVVIAGLLAAYALMIALPFVPGIEIGIALMFLEGGAIAPFVYLATVAGLCLAYLAGSLLPYAMLYRLFADLRLRPATRLLARIAPLTPDQRLAALQAKLPGWLSAIAVKRRYILLGVLVNIPGNGVVGGGGGLALLAGLSRLYRPGATALTLLIAVAPVPLMVWLFDRPPLPLPS